MNKLNTWPHFIAHVNAPPPIHVNDAMPPPPPPYCTCSFSLGKKELSSGVVACICLVSIYNIIHVGAEYQSESMGVIGFAFLVHELASALSQTREYRHYM